MAFRMRNEQLGWLNLKGRMPAWSRRFLRNTAGKYRNQPDSKLLKYDIEIEDRLWSLWGTMSPDAHIFQRRFRGRQYVAIYVMACCAANVFDLLDWTGHLLDKIVKCGNRYFRQSITHTKGKGYSLNSLNIDCALDNLKFVVYMEQVCEGKLYVLPSMNIHNLATALAYFFEHHQYGILSVRGRALAIGRNAGSRGGYFMYDCQETGNPLFPKRQGASYLLRSSLLHVLHYCIVVTLNVTDLGTRFVIYRVEVMQDGASLKSHEKLRIVSPPQRKMDDKPRAKKE